MVTQVSCPFSHLFLQPITSDWDSSSRVFAVVSVAIAMIVFMTVVVLYWLRSRKFQSVTLGGTVQVRLPLLFFESFHLMGIDAKILKRMKSRHLCTFSECPKILHKQVWENTHTCTICIHTNMSQKKLQSNFPHG